MKVQKICYIWKEKTEDKHAKDKKILQIQGQYYFICSVPKKIPIVFHNGSNYHYHFIIKQLAETIEGQFTSLGEDTEKYITF